MEEIKGFVGEYEFLSNFSKSPILWNDMTYPTVEHAFQASKTKDIEEKRRICALPTPGKAKREGRNIRLRPDWESMKLDVMLALVRRKFEIPSLHQKLLETGDAYLEETNNWGDKFWGVDGTGENQLGKILMQIRDEIRNEE